jgi:hypothetical protein
MILMPAILVGLAMPAWPQVARPGGQTSPSQSPPVVQAAPDPSVPGPSGRPGFIDEVGKLFQGAPLSLDLGLPSLKTPQQTIEELNSRARDAGDNLSRLSKGQVYAGRVKCPLAANGAPDCKSAAVKLCAEKGFRDGQSVDSDSAESCSASVLLSGKTPAADECRVENFVIRALCQ